MTPLPPHPLFFKEALSLVEDARARALVREGVRAASSRDTFDLDALLDAVQTWRNAVRQPAEVDPDPALVRSLEEAADACFRFGRRGLLVHRIACSPADALAALASDIKSDRRSPWPSTRGEALRMVVDRVSGSDPAGRTLLREALASRSKFKVSGVITPRERSERAPTRDRLVIAESNEQATLDGRSFRVTAKQGRFLRRLLEQARKDGGSVRGLDFESEGIGRPDRLYGGLPEELKDIVSTPNRGSMGYHLLDFPRDEPHPKDVRPSP